MTIKISGFCMRSLAAAAVLGALMTTATAADFAAAVRNVLEGQTDGPVAEMDAATKRKLIACVTQVLSGVPEPQKQYIAEGNGFEEQEHRFGEVVMANQAEWKQKITKECGDLAV